VLEASVAKLRSQSFGRKASRPEGLLYNPNTQYMEVAIFTNDDNVSIKLLPHRSSADLKRRDKHEVLFRRVNTCLLKKGIINRNIIDLGAWIGDNTIPWAKNLKGQIYSIDPCPNNCKFIQDTCALNDIQNVTVIQSAISEKNETLSTNDNLDHCSFVYGNPGDHGRNRVDAVSLNFLYQAKVIDNIGYIHLDVEGMEYKILKGSTRIIDECRPVISFEQHLEIDDYDAIVAFFRTKNYRVFLLEEVLAGCRPDCRNSFAFPNEVYTEGLISDIHNYLGQEVLLARG